MAKPILAGYDPKTADRSPVEFGAAASRFTGAPLIVGSVHAEAAAAGQAEEELAGDPGDALAQLRAALADEGFSADTRPLPGSSAARALHHAAEEVEAGLLVVGSTNRGAMGRVLPGSTAERLMHGAPCPIAVVPHGWRPGGGLNTIGVAYVDTPEAHEALRGAHALAKRAGARLRVLTAARPHGYGDTYGGGPGVEAVTFEEVASDVRVTAERAVEKAIADAGDVPVEPDVSVGDPADFLIAASEQLDLLVCGSRGYGPARAVLLGGVSRRVTNEAHCPVIVLARGVEAGLEALMD
jgi:nucleotide-binding universal stress UspA family protein